MSRQWDLPITGIPVTTQRQVPVPAVDYDDKAYQERMRTVLQTVQLCGCGSPEESWQIILDMLERAEDHKARGYFSEPLGDIPARAVEFIAHVLGRIGMLEHGSSIMGAWLTDSGRQVLAFLRQFGVDDEAWPEWWRSCSVGEGS